MIMMSQKKRRLIDEHEQEEQQHLHQREEELIPGLPNSIVLDCLLPRIPWHARPRMKSVSKAWREVLQHPSLYGSLTRQSSCEVEGLIVVHQLSEDAGKEYFKRVKIQRWMPHPHALSIYDEESKLWRKLPPIPAVHPLRILHDCGVASVDQKLFVMGGWDPKNHGVSSEVYMLDLGSGLWQWQKRRSMHTAKSLFYCRSVEGKIYVVGGSSSQNHSDEEPHPEVYHVESDCWELLPRVTLSRSFQYTGLAIAGSQALAYGFCPAERGELVNFWKVYDAASRIWIDWDCDLAGCSNLLAGDHDLRDGVVNRLDMNSKRWVALDGKVCAKTWRWEGGRKVLSDSTCAHSFFAVTEGSKPHVYATICEGDNRCLTIWRGDMDYSYSRVWWRQIELPGNLSMCSEMCYLQG